MSQSKLARVREALAQDPRIAIVGQHERNIIPLRDAYWSHMVDIHVAPLCPVYTGPELQTLMMSLVPDLEPTCKDNFRDLSESMEFGKLYFDEVIGMEIVVQQLELTDPSMWDTEGFADGKRVIRREKKIQRRIWVRLFPDFIIAHAAFEGRIAPYTINKGRRVERNPSELRA